MYAQFLKVTGLAPSTLVILCLQILLIATQVSESSPRNCQYPQNQVALVSTNATAVVDFLSTNATIRFDNLS